MKKRFLFLHLFCLFLLGALLWCLMGCQGRTASSVPEEEEHSQPPQGGTEGQEVPAGWDATGLTSTLEALLAGKTEGRALSDLSPFTRTVYGTVGRDYVIRLATRNGVTQLTFDGGLSGAYEGRLSATETQFTLGDTSFRYAFFNDYLLLESKFGIHLLYPAEKRDVSAAFALFHTEKGAGGESLTFENGRADLQLPGLSLPESEFYLDDGQIVLFDRRSVNLALLKKAEASSTEQGSNLLSYVNDGNPSTRWSSDYRDNAWVTVDLEKECSIGTVRLFWEAAAPRDFVIQVSSDGKDWKQVYAQPDNTVKDAWGEYSFEKTSGRYVRIACGKRMTQYGVSLYELEVYEEYRPPVVFTYTVENGNLCLSGDEGTFILKGALQK